MTIQQAITHLEFLKVAGLLDAKPNQIDNDALDIAINALKDIEQPQGKWNVISLLDDCVYLRCSECGQSTRLVRDAKNEFCCIKDVRDKIIACPHCGAKMKGAEE